MSAREFPAPRRAIRPQVIERRLAITATQAVGLGNTLFSVDTTAGGVDLNLPLAADVPAGTVFEAVWAAGANALRWVPQAAETINAGGAGVAWSYLTQGVKAARIESDGVSAWRILETDGSANVRLMVSFNAQIPPGAATVTTGNLNAGDLSLARISVSIKQAAFDATLINVQAIGNVAGTVTINGNANATAAVDVSGIVDNR